MSHWARYCDSDKKLYLLAMMRRHFDLEFFASKASIENIVFISLKGPVTEDQFYAFNLEFDRLNSLLKRMTS